MDIKIDFLFKVNHDKPCYISPHTHTSYELVYYTEGNGTVKGNFDGYEYQAGDAIIIPPKTLHDEKNFYKSVNVVLGFTIDKNATVPVGKFHLSALQKSLIDSMANESASGRDDAKDFIKKELILLIDLLKRKDQVTNKRIENRFGDIYNYIDENFFSPVKIEYFAKSIGYSESHFRHTFTRKLKVPPKRFIIQKRLEKAKELLLLSSKSITEVALESGFYDGAQFTKIFKKNYGICPKDYRKRG